VRVSSKRSHQPIKLNGKYLPLMDPNDGVHGDEIWVSDGTVAGTYLLKDINPGSASSNASEFAIINEELYFVANDGADGKQLWKSDGTTAGTVMVTDINPGSFNPFDMTSVGNELFFFADDGVHGEELWASDGTTTGTAMVTDLVPGSGSIFPTNFADSNGKFFFDAFVSGLGDELFEPDGTQAGTFVVKDINPGSFGSNPRHLTDVSGELYFTANDGTHDDQIWKTDGTAANTVMVTAQGHFADNFYPLYNFNGKLVFDAPLAAAGVHGQMELYITDGTDASTTALTSVNSFQFQPQAFFAIGNLLYFTANGGTHGNELWVSDGTATGTQMLADINPSGSSNPPSFPTSTAQLCGPLRLGAQGYPANLHQSRRACR
jgi:ELWxxDGT repeat protein